MAHFRGEIRGGITGTTTAKQSTKDAGLTIRAQSWAGEVMVSMVHNKITGTDNVLVLLKPHPQSEADDNPNNMVELYRGPVDGWKHKHLIGTVGRMLLDDEARELKTLTSA